NFIPLGANNGGTSSVAVGARYAYATGRFVSPLGGILVRLIDRVGSLGVLDPALESLYKVLEARGIAITADERRLCIATRSPDQLLVIELGNVLSDNPLLRVIGSVPLPEGPDEVALIERAGLGPLVITTCATANMVAVYDDELGQLASEVAGVGLQPFG